MESIKDIIKKQEKVATRSVVYLNEKDEVVEKEQASKVIITEYDKNGQVINELIGTCG